MLPTRKLLVFLAALQLGGIWGSKTPPKSCLSAPWFLPALLPSLLGQPPPFAQGPLRIPDMGAQNPHCGSGLGDSRLHCTQPGTPG